MVAALPAFAGANFDAIGACLYHPEIKLTQKTTIEGGRVVYKELRRRCPQCSGQSPGSTSPTTAPEHSHPRDGKRGQQQGSSGGGLHRRVSHESGSVTSGSHHQYHPKQDGHTAKPRPPGSPHRTVSTHSVNSSPNSSVAASRTRSRSRSRRDRDRSGSRSPPLPSSSGSSRNHPSHGRSGTPSSARGGGGGGGSSSVASPGRSARGGRSRRSKSPSRSSSSRPAAEQKIVPAGRPRKQYDTPFDAKGRCHYHPKMQLAKKKLTGGWKVLLPNCPKCIEDQYNNETVSDNRSVASRRSNKSGRSAKSSRSAQSSRSGSGGGSSRKKLLSMKKSKSRVKCPFDNQGYCHRHSNVRLAKKKLTGGWKILQEFCVECADEDGESRSVGSRSSRHSRRSAGSRSSRRSASSRKSSGSSSKRRSPGYEEDATDSEYSTSQSEQNSKKIVKKMNYIDDDEEEGLYSGHINSKYKPHGSGKMVYSNGKRFTGEWCEGSKVHGKTNNAKSSSRKNDPKDNRQSRSREPAKVGGSKNGKSSSSAKVGGINDRRAPSPPDHQEEKQQRYKQKQQSLKEYKQLYNTATVVKNMIFVDFFGDRGRYTGEVNGQKMPHGMGSITYDHGLVQEGMWSNGVLDEDGSTASVLKQNSSHGSVEGVPREMKSSRRRARSKDP